jgi:hypothetical protein
MRKIVSSFLMGKPAGKSKYIPWAELLRKTFGFEVVCQKCHSPLRLIALIQNQGIAKKILTAMIRQPPNLPPGAHGGHQSCGGEVL